MLLDWQFDFWYMFNAMPKRQEETRMCHAVGSSQLEIHSEMWLGLSFSTSDLKQVIAYLQCKGSSVSL